MTAYSVPNAYKGGMIVSASDNGLTVPAVNLEKVLVAGSGVAYESTLAGPAVVNVTGTGSTEDEDCRSASLENVAGYGLYTTFNKTLCRCLPPVCVQLWKQLHSSDSHS